ncbi:ArnT family glycosyltransferase [Oligoflexus tunisiensis]|uniref:ArnT family glycosyltransferase n=1 Tax=Oligoflexus tunisiensis TaxID=708132 RepID=UPI00114C98F1|nr:glycosyltransferase family 39 protein [Oligoflexus tunisiensis]
MKSGTWKDAFIAKLSAGTGWALALLILWLGFVFHLWIAAYFPLVNDEAYYWDWGQRLQLSYYDHPPGIAWVTALNAKVGSGLLSVRLLIPFLHAWAAFFLLLCLREIHPAWRSRDLMLLALATLILPGFGLLGIFALPDAGLYPCLTAALWLTLRYRRQERLSANQGLAWGFVLGLAGIFKYHALPMGLGLGAALFWLRRGRARTDLMFWLNALGMGLLVTTPVWVWNLQHDWASIRFQTRQGFGDLKWFWEGPLRTILGLLLFLTPWFAWLMIKTMRRLMRERERFPQGVPLILLSSCLPLIILLAGLSFVKPVRLHWMMPGFWLLLPALVALYGETLARSKRSWILAVLLSVLLPSLLARRDVRRNLLSMLSDRDTPLTELTLWSDLNNGLQTIRQPILQKLPAHCPVDGYLAGQRWYIVAQLHFLNQRMPVISLDRQHPSFYTFRDVGRDWVDCPVTLVIPEANYRKADYEDLIMIKTVTPIPLQRHPTVNYLAVTGRLIAPPEQVLQSL